MPPKKKLKPEKNQCTLGISGSKFEIHQAATPSAQSTTSSDNVVANPRTYCAKWEKDYPWLFCDDDGMKCQICVRNGRKNAFVSGTTNLKKKQVK